MKKQRQRARRKVTPLVGRAWAWKIQDMSGRWSLCNWSEPSRDMLERSRKKPSPEAVAVWVKMTANPQVSGPTPGGSHEEN